MKTNKILINTIKLLKYIKTFNVLYLYKNQFLIEKFNLKIKFKNIRKNHLNLLFV